MHGMNNIKSVFMHFPLKAQRGLSIAQAVSRRPLAAKFRVRSRAVHVGYAGGKSCTMRFYSNTSVSRCRVSPTTVSYYFIHSRRYIVLATHSDVKKKIDDSYNDLMTYCSHAGGY